MKSLKIAIILVTCSWLLAGCGTEADRKKIPPQYYFQWGAEHYNYIKGPFKSYEQCWAWYQSMVPMVWGGCTDQYPTDTIFSPLPLDLRGDINE